VVTNNPELKQEEPVVAPPVKKKRGRKPKEHKEPKEPRESKESKEIKDLKDSHMMKKTIQDGPGHQLT